MVAPIQLLEAELATTRLGGMSNVTIINQGTISADVTGAYINIVVGPSGVFTNLGTLQANNGGTLQVGGMVNQGTVVANNGTLTLNGSWTNAGTITATNATTNLGGAFTWAGLGTFNRTGGTVNLTGTLDDTAGVLALNAATGSWRLAGGTVKGGVITTADGSELVPISGTLDGVTLNCDLNVTGSSASVRVINGLTLNGVATLGNNYASLGFEGTQALSGSGSVVFQSGGTGINGLLATQSGTTLTIGPGITVHGGGAHPTAGGGIGYDPALGGMSNVTIINQGTISADVTVPISISWSAPAACLPTWVPCKPTTAARSRWAVW